MEVIGLKEDGDGNQDVRLFKQPVLTCYDITCYINMLHSMLYNMLNRLLNMLFNILCYLTC